MTQLLIASRTGYDKDWAASVLADIFHKDMKAAILPLEYEEGWASDRIEAASRFDAGSERRYDVERPLRAYGIRAIRWLVDCHPDAIRAALKESDVLCLFGSDASQCMERMEDLGLEDAVRSFDGILIVLSTAASILEAQFEGGDAWDSELREGLGVLPGVHFLMHYEESEESIRKMIRMLERDGRPILVLSDRSGVYLEEGHIELLGDAFIADENDLDELYSLL